MNKQSRLSRRHLLGQLALCGLLTANGGKVFARSRSLAPSPLFIDIGKTKLRADIPEFVTQGWASFGMGAGRYVFDDLARQLAPYHPRFCAISANGLAVRLVPEGGIVSVEQAGAIGDQLGSGQNNDRPAFQAAIDYARAIGIENIMLGQQSYAIWHSPTDGTDGFSETAGHGLVIAPDQRVRMTGACAAPSKLLFRTATGESFDGDQAGVNYEVSGGTSWRGCGLVVRTHRDPANPARSGLTLENMWLDGGYRRDVINSSPQRLDWDGTHKGIMVWPDRWGGDVALLNSVATGWRGEMVYASNDPQARLFVRNSTITDSNGQGLNPNGCKVDVDGCSIKNCYIGIEGWTGARGGRIVRTRIVDCGGKSGSGVAFSLQGGMYGRSARSEYYAPTEVVPGEIPLGTIDITCKRSAKALTGWWLTGRLTLIDTALHLGEPMGFNEGSQGLDLLVTLSNQTLGGATIIMAGGSGTAGDMLTDNCKLQVQISDSPTFALPRHPPAMWYGSLGDNLAVQISNAAARPQSTAISAVTDFDPNITLA